MTYVKSSGAYKYEAVITVRVRFDMKSSSVGDARYGVRLITNAIENYITSEPKLNADDVTQQNHDNPYDQMIDVTYATTNVEAIDNASRSVHGSNIWLEGAYMSVNSLTNLWNRELRTLNNRNGDYSHVLMLNTREADYGDRDVITLPSMPESILRDALVDNMGEMNSDFVKRRNKFVRDVAIRTLEGLYEDGVDVDKESPEYVGVTIVNGQVVQSESRPEPF